MQKNTSRLINRELSWLEFNQRVLDEARNPDLPLLERLKFLAITASNLDEFFMVRVGGLSRLVKSGRTNPDPAGMTPSQQLQAITQRTVQMTTDQYACFQNELQPALQKHGIQRVSRTQIAALSGNQIQFLEQHFLTEIFPVLSPMAISDSADFPLLINHSLNICVRLKSNQTDEPFQFAIIPCGKVNRFISLPAGEDYAYVLLEDVIAQYVEQYFPGETVEECVAFRITRNADFSVDEEWSYDFLAEMQNVLAARKESECVRLEIANNASSILLAYLQQRLHLSQHAVYPLLGPLDLSAFIELTGLSGFGDLKYSSWPPKIPPGIEPGRCMFDLISERAIILNHPYESYEPVIQFIEEAAADPDVLAIKQTLYRVSKNSAIVKALSKAAENGKYVTVIVELKARFDEARNIEWAQNLERNGVQVIYGVKGLKTHAKACLIVRKEQQGIKRYLHFGTGNYNESTARLYSDISFLTCDDDLGADATSFFNAITGYSQLSEYHKLQAAPTGLRTKVLEMIQAETESARQGLQAHMMIKLNSLVDPEIIDACYEASRAGVKIQFNVRGICCLRPGVPNLSENISVMSIVDRFLEHSRIFYFYHGGDERTFISSADWMPRNLDRRIELLVPVEDKACSRTLINLLHMYLSDTIKGKALQPDGSYKSITAPKEREPVRAQEELYNQALQAQKQAQQLQRTQFVPHRAPDVNL